MLAQSFAEFLETRPLFPYPLRPQLAQEPKLRPMGLHGFSQVVKILVLRLILGSFQHPLRPSQIGLHACSENDRGRVGFGRQFPAIHVETHLLDPFEPSSMRPPSTSPSMTCASRRSSSRAFRAVSAFA